MPTAPTSTHPAIEAALARTRARSTAVRVAEGGLLFALFAAAMLLGCFALDNLLHLGTAARLALTAALLGGAGFLLVRRVLPPLVAPPSDDAVALLIERGHPEIDNRLINALRLERDRLDPEALPFLDLLWQEVGELAPRIDLERVVARRDLRRRAHLALVPLVALLLYGIVFPAYFANAFRRYTHPWTFIAPLTRTVLRVEPGNARLLRGESLTARALCTGELPPAATLRTWTDDGQADRDMTWDGEAFAFTLENVVGRLRYQVFAGDAESEIFEVRVAEPPRVVALALEYRYPEYTGLPSRREEPATGDIAALPATRVTITAHVGGPFAEAALALDGAEPAAARRVDERTFAADLTVERKGHYRLVVRDAEGLTEKDPPTHAIVPLEDRPPAVEIRQPGRDVTMAPDGELAVAIRASDDFGLRSLTLRVTREGADAETEVGVWLYSANEREAKVGALLRAAELGVKAGISLRCFARARDSKGQETASRAFTVKIVAPGAGGKTGAKTAEAAAEAAHKAPDPQAVAEEARKQEEAQRTAQEKAVRDKLQEVLNQLREFEKKQPKVIESTEELSRKKPEDFTTADKKELVDLKQTEDKWGKLLTEMGTDLSKIPPQDFSNPSVARELLEAASEVDLAAKDLAKKKTELAVPVEQAGLALAQEITTDLERWLASAPDSTKWNMEQPTQDADVPMADLPEELEDLVGELIDQEDKMDEDAQDVTSSWMDSIDKGAGWGASDGPISNMSAKGVTGNLQPNSQEVGGRSGEGRSGKSSGQMVEETASGKGGKQTPTRSTPDPYEAGQVKDTSKDPTGGSTGGGKVSGVDALGLRGQAPPAVQQAMERLKNGQAAIRNKAEKVQAGLEKQHYYSDDLKRAIAQMQAMENDLARMQGADYAARRAQIVEKLGAVRKVIDAQMRAQGDAAARLPRELQRELRNALDEEVPEEYRDLLKDYYRGLSEGD